MKMCKKNFQFKVLILASCSVKVFSFLHLTGRAPPRNTTVDLNSGNVDVPPNMASWPSFHNGLAAGLKIAPASRVESAWIAYNKPKSTELANEYAGFLMALGLNGHLTKLATLNIHDYLTKVNG